MWKTTSFDLGELSKRVRQNIIVPSGGWIADVVPLVSNWTEIWDVFILAALFVVAWVVLRTSSCEVALVLGHVFDLTIPLQHYLNGDKMHADHLSAYWRALAAGEALEIAAFLLVHPELFTLVVCIKTTVLMGLWFARREDLSFVLGSSRSSSSESRWHEQLKKKGYTDRDARQELIDKVKKEPKERQEAKIKNLLDRDLDEVAKDNVKYGEKRRKRESASKEESKRSGKPTAAESSEAREARGPKNSKASTAQPQSNKDKARPSVPPTASDAPATQTKKPKAATRNEHIPADVEHQSRWSPRRRPKDIFKGNIPDGEGYKWS